MKITQVLYSGLGGHGSVAFSIMNGDTQKITRHSFLFYGIEPVREEYVHKCRENNFAFDAINTSLQGTLSSWFKAFKAIRKQSPDVVILHSATLFGIVPLLRLFGIKVIAVDHTSNSAKRKNEWIALYILRIVANHLVFLTSSHVRELLKLKGEQYLKPGKYSIINNGIDIEKFRPTHKPPTPPFHFFMLARFGLTQDFNTLIRAGKILKDHLGPDRFKIWLAGDGINFPVSYQLAESLSVLDVVSFKGLLDENGILATFNVTHLYVHSTISEAMSTSIMQAMACGLPVIASDIPGNHNLIINGENGIFFEAGNEKDLASKLSAYMEGKFDTLYIAQNARKFAEAKLSMETMFRKYYEIIKNI